MVRGFQTGRPSRRISTRFSGTAALDDGTVLPVRDLIGFAEEVENHW